MHPNGALTVTRRVSYCDTYITYVYKKVKTYAYVYVCYDTISVYGLLDITLFIRNVNK